MCFDRLFVSLYKKEYEPRVNDINFIHKKFEYVNRSKELYVFFPPWHNKFKDNKILRRKILQSGSSFLEYAFNGHVLSSDYKLSLKYFKKINKEILKEIKKFKKEYHSVKINFIGVSLGCINEFMVANTLKKINKFVVIVPGHCLAESLWKGIKSRKIRREFEERGISLEKLKKYWKELSPQSNLRNINAEETLVYLSKADKVIPYYCGKRLVKKMKGVELHENRFFGHYLTILLFYLFPKRFLKI
jgi:hypothetical protein